MHWLSLPPPQSPTPTPTPRYCYQPSLSLKPHFRVGGIEGAKGFVAEGGEVGALVVAAAGLAAVEDGAGHALRLVAHLQDVDLRVGDVVVEQVAADGEDEVGDVGPVGAAGDGVLVDGLQAAAVGGLVEFARMGHDDDPDVALACPLLEGDEHAADALGLALAVRQPQVEVEVRVDDEEVERTRLQQRVGSAEDVLGRRPLVVGERQVAEVLVERVEERAQVVVAELRQVRLSREEAHVTGRVGHLVGHLERAEGDMAVAVDHEVGTDIVEDVGLTGARRTGDDDHAAHVGEVEGVVREGAVAEVVAVVVVAAQTGGDIVAQRADGDEVVLGDERGPLDDGAHGLHAVLHEDVADVLASRGQRAERAAASEMVGEVLLEFASRAVAVAADDDAVHPVQPRLEGLEGGDNIRLGTVGDADDMAVARLVERQHVLLALGDDDAVDGLAARQGGVDAVDVVRGAGLGGRLLRELLLQHGAVLDVDGPAVHAVDVAEVVVADAHAQGDERLPADVDGGQVIGIRLGEVVARLEEADLLHLGVIDRLVVGRNHREPTTWMPTPRKPTPRKPPPYPLQKRGRGDPL